MYKEAKTNVQKLIKIKERALNSLGLPSKITPVSQVSLTDGETILFDEKTNNNSFKNFYANLALNLVNKLPHVRNKFDLHSLLAYYKRFLNTENQKFPFSPTQTIMQERFKIDPKNYSPVSILPLVLKVIEKFVHNQTEIFLNKNKILYKSQSGFRKSFSMNSCLTLLTDKINKGFESGKYKGLILIDLQKAFHTLDHEIPLKRMGCRRFSKKIISWFELYLSGRTFKVNINKKFSDPGNLTCGIPQGSILGPLLF